MFCAKCGTQQPPESGFCIKCGEKLNVEGAAVPNDLPVAPAMPTTQQYATPTYQQPAFVTPPKKKNKKGLFFGIGVAIIAVVIFAASSGDDGDLTVVVDSYVSMVKSGALESYPNATVGKAFDAFLGNPKWESIVADDGKRYVNVKGRALYTGKEANFAVQFRVDYDIGKFEINAFEVNDLPQNNYMLWELLAKAYKDMEAPTY